MAFTFFGWAVTLNLNLFFFCNSDGAHLFGEDVEELSSPQSELCGAPAGAAALCV